MKFAFLAVREFDTGCAFVPSLNPWDAVRTATKSSRLVAPEIDEIGATSFRTFDSLEGVLGRPAYRVLIVPQCDSVGIWGLGFERGQRSRA